MTEPGVEYGEWIQGPDWQGPTAPYFSAQIAFPRGSTVINEDAVVAASMQTAFAGALAKVSTLWAEGSLGIATTSGLQGRMNIDSAGTLDHAPWYGTAEAADYSLYLVAPSAYWGDYIGTLSLPAGAVNVELEDYSASAFLPQGIHPTLSFKDTGQGMGLFATVTVRPADSKTDGAGVPQTVDEHLYTGSGTTRTLQFDVSHLGTNHGALVSLVLDPAQSNPTPVGPSEGTNPEGGPGDTYQALQVLGNAAQISLAGIYTPPRHRFIYAPDTARIDLLMRATTLTRTDAPGGSVFTAQSMTTTSLEDT